MDAGIKLDGVSKTFRSGLRRAKVTAVDNLSLAVDPGSVVAFVGPNGAGKTTTIYMLLGLLRPDQGAVHVLGGKPESAAIRRQIGYQSEIFHTYPFRTARGALRFYGRLSGIAPSDLDARIEAQLERVGLAQAANRKVGTFSKGMVQRLGLAQALLHEPALLILDEPATGLDPMGRRMVGELITEQKARGATVFFSSHVLADIEKTCDHVVMINHGQVVYSHPVSALAGERETWHIEVHGWNDAVAARLEDVVLAERLDGRAVLACGVEEKHDLLRRLLDLPLDIGAVMRKRRTIEDIYMERIGPARHG
jgi:ABC-2 type transport system ATP-binding protein